MRMQRSISWATTPLKTIISQKSYSDFNYLLVQYGIATNYVGTDINATWSPDNSNGYLNIQKDPLYILRSGYFHSSSLYGASVNGVLWSSTASSSTYGYYMDFGSSVVRPARSNYRYIGFPVRCKFAKSQLFSRGWEYFFYTKVHYLIRQPTSKSGLAKSSCLC